MCITHTCTDLLLSEEVPGPRASQGQNWKPELKVVWFGFKSDFYTFAKVSKKCEDT